MPRADAIDRLKSQLLVSGLQQKNAALFQVINQLIGILRDTTAEIEELTGGSGGGSVTTGQTILTLENEQATLPNSRRLVPGAGITMMTNGEQTVIGASPNPLGIEELREEFLMLQQGVQNSPAGPNAVSTPYVMIDDRGEDDYQEPPAIMNLDGQHSVAGNWLFNGGFFGIEGPSFSLINLRHRGAAADEQYWRIFNSAGQFLIQPVNDAYTVGGQGILLDRTGNAMTLLQLYFNAILKAQFDNDTFNYNGGLIFSGQNSVSLTADQTAWNPTGLGTGFYLSVTPNAPRIIRGITAKTTGTYMVIVNVGPSAIDFNHEDGAASAANRILNPGSVNIAINTNGSIHLYYDGIASRWRTISWE